MTQIPIKKQDENVSVMQTGLAFRPFFWLGSAFCILALIVWWFFWHGRPVLQPEGGLLWWHQHEMLFGFVSAIVAGFLLTAVQSWTGLASVSGIRLWLLVLLWGAARWLLAYPMGLSAWVLFGIDILFFPLVMAVMAQLVIKTKKWPNLIFVPVLLLLSFANAAMHWGKITTNFDLVRQSSYLAIWLITGLMLLLGGRVIPFFVSRALGTLQVQNTNIEQRLLMLGVFVLVLLQLGRVFDLAIPAWLFVLPIFVLIVLNIRRLASWQLSHCWHQPLLWGLHISYGFIILGLILWVLAEFHLIAADLSIHVLTIGAMMGMILAMMSRVSLGHTGRTIRALPGIGLALISLFVAAAVRGLLPIFWPQGTLWAYSISLLLCIAAFIWFLIFYSGPLWKRRADGKPG